MRQTVLHGWHVAHGAMMTDFNGWQMPLYYSAIIEEHHATRRAAGLFDLGHMGRVFIRGSRAGDFVRRVTPARLDGGAAGDVLYSFLLNEQGCPIDDITVYVMEGEYLLVVNAGNHDVVMEWLTAQAAGFADVRVEDYSYSWGMIALQGPRSREIATAALGTEAADLGYYRFLVAGPGAAWPGAVISATGYTGEQGYEVYAPNTAIPAIWDALVSAGSTVGLKPVGLGARDSLRLEACMPLYGHELNDAVSPLAAGLAKFLDLDRDFIGRDSLAAEKAAGPDRRLVAFRMNGKGPIPRQRFDVKDSSGADVGEVTSGIFSPTLEQAVGMAYVHPDLMRAGTPLKIDIRGRLWDATVVKKPLYKRSS